MVIAADTYHSDKFVNHACEYNQQNNHGRSIVIASVDKSKTAMNKASAMHAVSGLHLYRYRIISATVYTVELLADKKYCR